MDQNWLADELIVADEPSFPQRRDSTVTGKVVAVSPRFEGDTRPFGLWGARSWQLGGDKNPDWDAVQALTFTANGLAG